MAGAPKGRQTLLVSSGCVLAAEWSLQWGQHNWGAAHQVCLPSLGQVCFHTPGTCLWEEEPSSSRAGTDRAPAETSMAEGSRAARWARPLLSDIHSYPLATCCDRKIVGVQLCED